MLYSFFLYLKTRVGVRIFEKSKKYDWEAPEKKKYLSL